MYRYETMRRDPANWKFGVLYNCRDDPRIVVRNLLPFGWTWNFAHPRVYPAIGAAILALLAPAYLAWHAGLRSPIAICAVLALSLACVVLVAYRLSPDPDR